MLEGPGNYLKYKEVLYKFSNLTELCRALLNVRDEDKKSLQVIIDALYEHQIFSICIVSNVVHLLCDKLSNIYNLHIDTAALIKEAASLVEQNWDEVKKHINTEIDAWKLIDSIFNDKPGESKGSNP